MKYEYDENKSLLNKQKHGIFFPTWMVKKLDEELK